MPERMLNADSLPARWQYSPAMTADVTADKQWWQSFDDPMLDSLITCGLANNYDVAMAIRRVEIARQTLNQVRSQYYPTLAASAGWTRTGSAGAVVSSHTSSQTESFWSLGVDMSWQVDIFGRVSARSKQRKADVAVSKADFEGVMLSIASKIATTYIQLRMQQQELLVAQEHLKSQNDAREIAQARFDAGLSNALDLSQATTVYLQTQASIPALQRQIDASLASLEILLADPQGNWRKRLESVGCLPEYLRILPLGIPADLLRRRPDIIAAEATVAADAAAVGVAKKDFLPTLAIDGSIATEANKLGDLFGKHSLAYSIAPKLSWTIFDGFSRKYNVAIARETMQADIDSYNLTVLQAVSEVNTALAAYNAAVETVDLDRQVLEQAKKSLDLSFDLFKTGLSSYTDVANAQISYLTYANSLIEAKGNALLSLIDIYQALGGGFTPDDLR